MGMGRIMKWWKKKSDPLVEETLAFVQGAAGAEPERDAKIIKTRIELSG